MEPDSSRCERFALDFQDSDSTNLFRLTRSVSETIIMAVSLDIDFYLKLLEPVGFAHVWGVVGNSGYRGAADDLRRRLCVALEEV